MNIKQALDWGKSQLESLECPFLESEVLLAFCLDQNRAFLKMFPFVSLEEEELSLYKSFIQKRKENIPTAYITGQKEWCGMNLYVDENVLIPRDETEVLCDHIKTQIKKAEKIIDVGTGSGAMALFLKMIFPSAHILGLDISPAALQVAQKNADQYGFEVEWICSNLLEKISPGSKGDLMVANLPYLPTGYPLSREVQKEPSLALFAGKDGLDLIRQLEKEIREKKIHYQSLYLEFLPKQKKGVEQIFCSKAKKITFLKDVGGEIFFARIDF